MFLQRRNTVHGTSYASKTRSDGPRVERTEDASTKPSELPLSSTATLDDQTNSKNYLQRSTGLPTVHADDSTSDGSHGGASCGAGKAWPSLLHSLGQALKSRASRTPSRGSLQTVAAGSESSHTSGSVYLSAALERSRQDVAGGDAAWAPVVHKGFLVLSREDKFLGGSSSTVVASESRNGGGSGAAPAYASPATTLKRRRSLPSNSLRILDSDNVPESLVVSHGAAPDKIAATREPTDNPSPPAEEAVVVVEDDSDRSPGVAVAAAAMLREQAISHVSPAYHRLSVINDVEFEGDGSSAHGDVAARPLPLDVVVLDVADASEGDVADLADSR
ncbi:hypothetical protein DFJ73DRAFT_774155 [Zopfochytrium polystomum]|nr:hypothetical protein DFJ73DRAFT_774155 [Zopfochytrium polystomum]